MWGYTKHIHSVSLVTFTLKLWNSRGFCYFRFFLSGLFLCISSFIWGCIKVQRQLQEKKVNCLNLFCLNYHTDITYFKCNSYWKLSWSSSCKDWFQSGRQDTSNQDMVNSLTTALNQSARYIKLHVTIATTILLLDAALADNKSHCNGPNQSFNIERLFKYRCPDIQKDCTYMLLKSYFISSVKKTYRLYSCSVQKHL